MFTDLVGAAPGFMPSYLHLFHINYCEKNLEEAKKWLVAAIRYNPVSPHKMIFGTLSPSTTNGIPAFVRLVPTTESVISTFE